jgi:hypothetical protein
VKIFISDEVKKIYEFIKKKSDLFFRKFHLGLIKKIMKFDEILKSRSYQRNFYPPDLQILSFIYIIVQVVPLTIN